jgi:hypothetical protein
LRAHDLTEATKPAFTRIFYRGSLFFFIPSEDVHGTLFVATPASVAMLIIDYRTVVYLARVHFILLR